MALNLLVPSIGDVTDPETIQQIFDDLTLLRSDVDTLLPLAATWTTYTPTWAATGTQPAIGNGTLSGFYLQVGKFIIVRVRMLAGTTTTFGTGTYTFSLPVTAASGQGMAVGSSYLRDASATSNGHAPGSALVDAVSSTSTTLLMTSSTGSGLGSIVGATAPFTWANTDNMSAQVVYIGV